METRTVGCSRLNGFGAILLGAILVCLGIVTIAETASATSTIVYSNFTPTNGTGSSTTSSYQLSNSGLNGSGFFTATSVAVAFTVPAGSDYKLDKIEVVGAQTTGYGSYLHAYIVTNPTLTGTDYNAQSHLAATPSLVTFNASGYTPLTLKASQTYYLKLIVDTGSGLSVANWYKNNAGVVGTVLYNDPSSGSGTYQVLGTSLPYPVFRISGTAQAPPPPCARKVTYWDGTQLTPFFDGAHCYIQPVPAGATPFIYGNNGYYVLPDKSMQCVIGTGWYDGANCLYMGPKPSSGYISNDKMYVPPTYGFCSLGTLDGTGGCMVKAAPWGTHAFEYAGNWYFTTLYTCNRAQAPNGGTYDGANCYIMLGPPGTTPFIYGNNFYYAE